MLKDKLQSVLTTSEVKTCLKVKKQQLSVAEKWEASLPRV
ncbi:hypothetical protein ASZ90_008311 [hydrocarbon metagenome]|uniref:Uncharacterized protein n=1 Tax=hydrocarbon metagenome TaxID=938273 RepID=A0A0W8FLU4_9ZZZZ